MRSVGCAGQELGHERAAAAAKTPSLLVQVPVLAGEGPCVPWSPGYLPPSLTSLVSWSTDFLRLAKARGDCGRPSLIRDFASQSGCRR